MNKAKEEPLLVRLVEELEKRGMKGISEILGDDPNGSVND
jgi:hypothetical protein